MKSRVRALLLVFMVCGMPLAASEAEPVEGEIALSVGEVLHFELPGGVIGRKVPAALVEAPAAAQPVIRVALASDANGNRTLRIRSTYTRFIQFDFRICESARDPSCKTRVEEFVIEGRTEMSQLLQDHAARIVFYNFSQLRSDGENLSARALR